MISVFEAENYAKVQIARCGYYYYFFIFLFMPNIMNYLQICKLSSVIRSAFDFIT